MEQVIESSLIMHKTLAFDPKPPLGKSVKVEHATLLEDARAQLAELGATPAFVYFERILVETLTCFQQLTGSIPRRKCLYSLKAATFPFLLKTFQRHGIAGFDASSATEAVFAARLLGRRRSLLYVSAPALAERDLALLEGIHPDCVHLDSLQSYELFLRQSHSLSLGVRLNPAIGYSRVALHEAGGPRSCIGMSLDSLKEAIELTRRHGRTRLGLHMHLTCEAPDFKVQAEAVRMLNAELRRHLPTSGVRLTHLDLGGGLQPPAWDFNTDSLVSRFDESSVPELREAVEELLSTHRDSLSEDFTILFEPGDFLVCSSALLFAGAVEQRQSPNGEDHVMLDTNISHFPNILHYGNTPETLLHSAERGNRQVTLSGNSCLGGDRISKVELAEGVSPRSLVFSERGSYEYSQLNFFNGRYRPDVYCHGLDGTLRLVKRDDADDLNQFWREEVADYPEPYQSFHFFENLAHEEKGLGLYHPDCRFISSFELDYSAFAPPANLQAALVEGFARRSNTYGRSLGHDDVRDGIADYEALNLGQMGFYEREQVAFTLGATNAIWLTVRNLFHRSLRSLLIVCPSYYQFAFTASRHGIPWHHIHAENPTGPLISPVSADQLLPSLQAIHAALDAAPDVGALVIANPGLPYGKFCSPDDLRALAERARDEDWTLIVDETLAELRFADPLPDSWSWLDHSHPVIRIKSVSKSFGISGVRLGYLCVTNAARRTPHGDLLHLMADMADMTFSAPPAVLGPVMLAGLDVLNRRARGEVSDPDVSVLVGNLSKLQRRAQIAFEILDGAGIPCVLPDAGTSLMALLPLLPDCRTDSEPFFRQLVREQSMFIELGGLFNQNPEWSFTGARFGLGRADADFEKDLYHFVDFYRRYGSPQRLV